MSIVDVSVFGAGNVPNWSNLSTGGISLWVYPGNILGDASSYYTDAGAKQSLVTNQTAVYGVASSNTTMQFVLGRYRMWSEIDQLRRRDANNCWVIKILDE